MYYGTPLSCPPSSDLMRLNLPASGKSTVLPLVHWLAMNLVIADQIRYMLLSRSLTMIALMFVKGFDPISVTEALRAFPL